MRNPVNGQYYVTAWADWNQDGDFDDANELLFQRNVNFYVDMFLDNVGRFASPETAKLGKTRLRISFKRGGYATACETFQYGEVEDYTLNVVLPPATTTAQRVVATPLNARVVENSVQLNWVNSDADAAHFEVEKPNTNQVFQPIDAVVGQHYYSLKEVNPLEGLQEYRLKTVLKDGRTLYSSIQTVDYQLIKDFAIFPNPAVSEMMIDLKAFSGKPVTLRVSDATGKFVLQRDIEYAFEMPYRLNVEALPEGLYCVEIQCLGQRSVTRKVQIAGLR
jgi:hypothetical protein